MIRYFFILILFLAACGSWAGEQKKAIEPEKLKAPATFEPPLSDLITTLPAEPAPEFGRRSVWQLYAVDSRGRFRLRVIDAPSGAYYLHNLSQYPWRSVEPRHFAGFVVD